MLIIEGNSVYEIDEECLERRRVPKECGTAEKIEEMKQKRKEQIPQKRRRGML